MSPTELRKLSTASSKSIISEFESSKIRLAIDQKMKEAANSGVSELKIDYYYVKERAYGERYVGPAESDAIKYYRAQGFTVYTTDRWNSIGDNIHCLHIAW